MTEDPEDWTNTSRYLAVAYMSEDWGSSPWMSDAEAWKIILRDYYDQITRQVIAAVRRGAVSPTDEHDPLFDALILAVKLLQRHDPATGKFEHYLASWIGRSLRVRTGATERTRPAELEEADEEHAEKETSKPPIRAAPSVPSRGRAGTSDVVNFVQSIRGNSKAHTAKLRRIAQDYSLLGVPTVTLVSRYAVSYATVTEILESAPVKRIARGPKSPTARHAHENVNHTSHPRRAQKHIKPKSPSLASAALTLADNFHTRHSREELERRIRTIPERLQAIARMALLEGLSFSEIARRTGRNRPRERNHLRDRIVEIVRLIGTEST